MTKLRCGITSLFQNTGELDRWEALERGERVGAKPVEDHEIWREQLALLDLAEPLGFDSVWTFEHHFTPYIMLPNPMQFLAYIAGRTKRIGVGTMVTVPPWHNPLRLAEDITVLQYLLGPERTLTLGLGRGLSRREFAGMGVPMDESRERLSEAIEVLRLALHNERFSYKGQHYQYDNMSVRPQPLDSSIIDNAYNAWGSPASVAFAAESGLNPLSAASRTTFDFVDEMAKYTEARAEHGFSPAKRPILQKFMYCAESEDEAREAIMRTWPESMDSIIRHYEMTGDHLKDMKGYEWYANQATVFAQRGRPGSEMVEGMMEGRLEDDVWGTPKQCVEKIAYMNELVGPSEIVMVTAVGSQRLEEAEASVRLFAEKVLPEMQKMDLQNVDSWVDRAEEYRSHGLGGMASRR